MYFECVLDRVTEMGGEFEIKSPENPEVNSPNKTNQLPFITVQHRPRTQNRFSNLIKNLFRGDIPEL